MGGREGVRGKERGNSEITHLHRLDVEGGGTSLDAEDGHVTHAVRAAAVRGQAGPAKSVLRQTTARRMIVSLSHWGAICLRYVTVAAPDRQISWLFAQTHSIP